MDKKLILEEFKKISDQIRKYNPELDPFFDLKIKLKDYPIILSDFNTPKEHIRRQELVKKVINRKIESLFGKNYKSELNINLDGPLALNIADHHQVLNHPFLLSSNIVSSVDKLLKDKKPEAIIVISSGDVPPSNYFSKNGFTFHSKRVPIFNTAEKEYCTYYIPKRDFNFIEKLKLADRWKEFSQEEKDFLISECEKIKSYDYSKCKNYIDQITIINKNSWPYLFEEKLRANLPELIYLTQEEIVTDVLIELLEDDDNIVSRSIFDKKFRDCVLNNFRGNVVAWNEAEEKGTHFFWRKYPDRNQSLRLYIEGDKLIPKNERFKDLSVLLEKRVIIELLKKREIYPSLFTIFAVLNFYAGIKPLVGYGSVTYLHLMKESWLKTLREFGMDQEAELLKTVQTNGLIAGLSLAFKRFEGKLKALFTYDVFYEGGLKEDYLKKIFEMDYSDFFSVAAIEMYFYTAQKYIPENERIKPKIVADDFSELIFKWL